MADRHTHTLVQTQTHVGNDDDERSSWQLPCFECAVHMLDEQGVVFSVNRAPICVCVCVVNWFCLRSVHKTRLRVRALLHQQTNYARLCAAMRVRRPVNLSCGGGAQHFWH